MEGPDVVIPNNSTIVVTNQGDLPLSNKLSMAARNTMILPGLKSASLISIGQLCDNECDVLPNKKKTYCNKKQIDCASGNTKLFGWTVGYSNI